jgi:HEAT repeat protein
MSLWTLGRMGTAAAGAVPTLLAALQDEDAETSVAARLALVAVAGHDPAVVNQVVELLRHANPRVRQTAIATLHQLNLTPDTEPRGLRTALRAALTESHPWLRLHLAELLLRLDPQQRTPLVPVLLACLREPDPFLRRSAARALQRVADEAMPALIQGLQDRDPARRRVAAESLAEIVPGVPGPQRELKAALTDDVLEVRIQAAFALTWSKSAEGVPALVAALKDPEMELRQRGAAGLCTLGPLGAEAVPALVEALGDQQDENLRVAAARALGLVGAKKTKEVVPALTRALADARPQVRSSAAEALAAIAPQPRTGAAFAQENEAIPALIELLADPFPDVNAKAQIALQKLGDVILPDLLQALNDPNPEKRRMAASVLARKGGNRLNEVGPALKAMFQDPEPRVALAAAEAFLRLNQTSADAFPSVLPLLRTALKDPNPAVRLQALKVFGSSQAPVGPAQAEWAALCREGLKDPEVRVRIQAIGGMRSDVYREKDNRVALLVALRDPEKSVRQTAAWGLSWYGPEAREAVPLLLEMLRAGPDAGTRTTAAFALGRVGREDPEVANALREALAAKEKAASRSIVIGALGMLGEVAKPAAPLLLEALQDRETQVRDAALDAVSRMGLDASVVVPPLLEMLGNQDDAEDPTSMNVRLQDFVKKMGPAGLTEVNNGLSDRNPVRRLGAVIFLAKLSPAAPQAKRGFEQALKDEDAGVRVRAAEALWLIDHKADRVVSLVVAALKDSDLRVRRRAIRVVNLIGPQAKEAVPGLIEALREKDDRLRLQVVQALGRIGPEASPAVGTLLEAVKDTKPGGPRLAALQSLGEIGPKAGAAVPTLLAFVKDFDVLVRVGALRALGRIGPQNEEVGAAVVEALGDPVPSVRLAAVEAAGRAGPRQSGNLTKLLKDDDPNLRFQVASALSRFGPEAKGALPALQQAVEDEDRRVAVQVAEALWLIDRQKTGMAALMRGLVAKDVAVRLSALRVLGNMGPEARDAVPALLSAAQDSDNLVRGEAVRALQRVDPEAAAKVGKP